MYLPILNKERELCIMREKKVSKLYVSYLFISNFNTNLKMI